MCKTIVVHFLDHIGYATKLIHAISGVVTLILEKRNKIMANKRLHRGRKTYSTVSAIEKCILYV